ncbi:thioredoxin domain-containing protein 3 [Marmota marmota marmota]|uniref:thioredoxin domain-containing protein 3 n=1 Tax=Marmota marmota marmota TaxID=9994 RepID=UPI000762BE0B|nr:thioredoxin domain-containing protein 3 [Marmota marmota marmota]
MASKKREVQLQTVINSQSQWDVMLQNKGLTVIDVYQAWCGPCKAVQPLFRKMKNELNEDEILHFVVAEADSIVTLHSFKDKCEPVFLLSLNGKIIAKIEGANAPLINRKVTNLINEERKIIAGEMERPEYNEILLMDLDSEENEEAHGDNVEEHYSIILIKPDAVVSNKALEIKKKIIKEGYVIEVEEALMLTEGQVRDFYGQIEDEPDFEDFVSLMTTGLSYVLVVSPGNEKPDSLEEAQLDIESNEPPEDLPEAEVNDTLATMKKLPKAEVNDTLDTLVTMKKQDSLQELLDQQHISQYCDIEDDATNVARLLDVFFPDFKLMKSKKEGKTMALLRPDLVHERKDEVLDVIEAEGFKILFQRQIELSEEEAQMLCQEYENEDYYDKLIENMMSGPSLLLVLLRENGLQYWKKLLGPTNVNEVNEDFPESLCARFAMDGLPFNQLYGSNSSEIAQRDIEYFFPLQSTLALIKPHVTHEQREIILKIIKDSGFELTQLKEIVLTPEEAKKVYFRIENKEFYKDVLAVLAEGPSLIMVLTRWNAIAEWRRLIGTVDPEEARLLSPESIRARFGINILKNAVHGASNTLEASEAISRVFGDDENPENN